MTSLGKYIDSLVSDLQTLGLHATLNNAHFAPEAGVIVNPLHVQTIQFEIPLEACATKTPSIQSIASQVRQWTMDSLAFMLPFESLPSTAKARLQRAIDKGSKQVQNLLSKDEPVLHRVLLDYAQSVIAEIWDDCKDLFTSMWKTIKDTAEDGYASFEQASKTLVDWLEAKHIENSGQIHQDNIPAEVARSTTVTEHGVAHVRLVLTA